MNQSVDASQHKVNLRYLMAEVTRLCETLQRFIPPDAELPNIYLPENQQNTILQDNDVELLLNQLCVNLELNATERDILTLCAGVELDPRLGLICAAIQQDTNLNYPTFSLFSFCFPNFDWSVITEKSPLVYFSLINIGTGPTLTLSPLRISKRVFCYLLSQPSFEEKLQGFVTPIKVENVADTKLQSSHQKIAAQIAATWLERTASEQKTVVQLCGLDNTTNTSIIATACHCASTNLHVIQASLLPSKVYELNELVKLWKREALLTNSALLLDCHDVSTTDPKVLSAIQYLVRNISSQLVISSSDRLSISGQKIITLDVNKLTAQEQFSIWQNALGSLGMVCTQGQVEALVSQFNLTQEGIYKAASYAAMATSTKELEQNDTDKLRFALWDACRKIARPQLDDLAQRINTKATWDDLILPEAPLQTIREMINHVQNRMKVYEKWGFARKNSRGLSITALLAGDSGTGKTMTAEVIANELRLDLYRIDLSAIVSKYIGETEKNIRRVFDAAEYGGAVLLFDEADALFSKRTQVKDSHDRNANMEVNYLLQRMEAYQGLAILTTNLKDSIDSAFMRRIRFVVKYRFPDEKEREQMWQRIFPSDTPTEGLDHAKLAKLCVTGGNIRNIALNAAFLAAQHSEAVMMKHIKQAAETEYLKSGQTLSNTEIRGWGC